MIYGTMKIFSYSTITILQDSFDYMNAIIKMQALHACESQNPHVPLLDGPYTYY